MARAPRVAAHLREVRIRVLVHDEYGPGP
jgi:hypothetical protein